MTSAAASEALEAALSEIAAAALAANCGYCWASPGAPCATLHPGGTHVARFARAYRKGLITSADLSLVLDTLDGFTGASVLYEAAA